MLRLSNVRLYEIDGTLLTFHDVLNFIDNPSSKEKIKKYIATDYFIQQYKYVKACFYNKAADIDRFFSSYSRYKTEKHICLLILYAAIHNHTDLFADPRYKLLIDNFNLLMPVAAAFSAKEYIKSAYHLQKFNPQDTAIGLHIAIKLQDFDLLQLITHEASNQQITISKISRAQVNKQISDLDYPNPLLTAIQEGYLEGVIFLLAEGYELNIFNDNCFNNYLHTAIYFANVEKLSETKERRKEIIHHLALFHADPLHKILGKNALDALKEAKLNELVPLFEKQNLFKQTIFSFFYENPGITIDKNNINLVCEYIAPDTPSLKS